MYEEDIKEKRKEKRVGLVYNLAAFDRVSGEVVGYLADITSSGFMLLCEKPLDMKKEYYFKIEINAPSAESRQIQFDAECCWRKTNDYIDFYNCGFKFTKIDTEYIGEIEYIIEQFCIEDE